MLRKYFPKTILIFLFFLSGITTINAQQTLNPSVEMIKGKEYTFTAQAYSSTTVSMRQITDTYTVKVKQDSVIGSLPYYGQSYNAQINVRDGGLKFTSAKFDYSFSEKKKGKCEVTIKPKDDRTVQIMYLTVFADYTAELMVSSANKEPMTFYGYVNEK